MQFNLKKFLTQGKLGGVSLGETKTSIAERLGMPEWWEGKPELTHEQSIIWVYGRLQITFDETMRSVKLAIYYDARGGQRSDDVKVDKLFDDAQLGPMTTVHEFREYLSENGIGFNENVSDGRHTLIESVDGGTTATFKYKTDFQASVAAERHITSEAQLLVSIVAERAKSF